MEMSTDNVKLTCLTTDGNPSYGASLTTDILKYEESISTTTHEDDFSRDIIRATNDKTRKCKMIKEPEDQTDISIITAGHSTGSCCVDNIKEDGDQQHAAKTVEGSVNKSTTTITETDSITKVHSPQYDLSALWDTHCKYEFDNRDVPATMSTMVSEPYVNHIPTMTGGVGAKDLARFYEHHFINGNPEDTCMIPISRTIGADRVVDEMLFCFTHDREIDWMLPGVTPTGKSVKIPLVAIVGFQGDKLSHEHIYWDQASVLAQIGLLDTKNLPVAGVETANKLLDKSLPSDTLMKRWAESANKN